MQNEEKCYFQQRNILVNNASKIFAYSLSKMSFIIKKNYFLVKVIIWLINSTDPRLKKYFLHNIFNQMSTFTFNDKSTESQRF